MPTFTPKHAASSQQPESPRPRSKGWIIGLLAVVVVVVAVVLIVFMTQQSSTPETQTNNVNANAQVPEISVPTNINTEANTETKNEAKNENATAAPTQSAAMQNAQAAVSSLVQSYGDAVEVTVVPLDGSLGFSINGDKSIISASMIKLLILSEYLGEVDAGTLNPNDTYTLQSSDIVGGTGKLQSDGAGSTHTYEQMAHYMVMYSDNVATNMLINRMGMDAINAKAKQVGLPATDLQRKMMDLNSGLQNHISSDDAAKILAGIANHTLASESMCKVAEGYLLDQTDKTGIMAGLPSGVSYGHKSGDLNNYHHDGGIVYAEYPYVIVVLTNLGLDQGNALMAQVSEAVYNALK